MSKFSKYLDRQLLVMLFLGFASGLPLALSASTLEAWFTMSGRSYVQIGLLSLVGLPYTLKFLWAPFLDRFGYTSFGLRRTWMLITQIGLVCFLLAMSLGDPAFNPLYLAALALCVTIFSATQDVAIDAYRAEVLSPQERGLGVAMFVTAYRAALLIASGIALILADHVGWAMVYRMMAGLMMVGVFTTLFITEPPHPEVRLKGVQSLFLDPIKNILTRDKAIWIIALVVLYKFGDAFIAKMTTPFLLRELQFTLTEVGTVNKVGGLAATVVGLFVGGILMTRLSLYRALLLFGFAQAFSNLMFLWLAYMGHQMYAMVITLMVEQFCGGLGMAAYLSLLMSLCDSRFTAFQFAFFSALSSLPRELLGPVSGYLVQHVGWISYFTLTFITSFPGLFCLWMLRNRINKPREYGEPTLVDTLEAS
ncbi:MAG: AmpG family muropeptide MFS transporter [Gammaproteobacteria bacterium]